MAREIKFRGKDILTDKWVYGDLLHLGNACAIVTSYEEEELEVNPISDRLEIRVEDIAGVYPETVGQFTGLLDKNGKEIWEHDIVDWDGVKLLVEFIDGSFCIRENYEGATFHDLFFERDEINVIGNIYDKDFGYVIKNTKTNNIG